jgi:hypothetical protein
LPDELNAAIAAAWQRVVHDCGRCTLPFNQRAAITLRYYDGSPVR